MVESALKELFLSGSKEGYQVSAEVSTFWLVQVGAVFGGMHLFTCFHSPGSQ